MRNQIPTLVSLITLIGCFKHDVVFAMEKKSPSQFSVEEPEKLFVRQWDFKEKNDIKNFKRTSKELKKIIDHAEKHIKTVADAEKVSTLLDRMAFSYCPVISRNRGLASTVSEEDFKIGNVYKLRAIALRDQFVPDRVNMTHSHRELLNWYIVLGRKREVDEQTKILSDLLDGTDPAVINPPPPRCPGCGMG